MDTSGELTYQSGYMDDAMSDVAVENNDNGIKVTGFENYYSEYDSARKRIGTGKYTTLGQHRTKIGHSISLLRKRKGNYLTQEDAALYCDIPQSSWAKMESGYIKDPTLKTLLKIANTFGVSLDFLAGRKRMISPAMLSNILTAEGHRTSEDMAEKILRIIDEYSYMRKDITCYRSPEPLMLKF